MKDEEYLTRFCFGRAVASEDVPPSVAEMTLPPMTDEKIDLRLYSDGRFDFLMVDTAFSQSLSEIKKHAAAQRHHSRVGPLLTDERRPLRRIFKKEPLDEYKIRKLGDGQRLVLTLEIKNDPELLKEYVDAHHPDNVWPQVLANMDTVGVRDMELYLLGYQAFLVMDTATSFDMNQVSARWSELPEEKEGQRYVARFQKANTQSNAAEKWNPLTQIV